MDPLSALGLAAAAAQFFAYGVKLVSGTVQRYQSIAGASEEQLDLESTTKRLCHFVNQLDLSVGGQDQQPQPQPGACDGDGSALLRSTLNQQAHSAQSSQYEIEIKFIVQNCRELAQELLELLEDLKVKGKHRLVKSFLLAAKSIGKDEKAQKLRDRLLAAQSELSLWLMATINDDQSKSMLRLLDIADRVDQVKIHQADLLVNLRARLIHEMDSNHAMTGKSQDLILRLFQEAQKAESQLKFLGSLRYPTMTRRESNITTAHQRTFDWMLTIASSNTGAKFQEWLKTGTGIYWVTGKAGSGKSTLMKYIASHELTRSFLQDWAGSGTRLVMASHFFWIGGFEMEKTQEGMLRTLLATILTQVPELMPIISPNRFKSGLLQGEPWIRIELFDTFRRALEQREVDYKFCLFIDGLDEYAGDHDEIARFIKDITALPNVKVCVACREWLIFEYHFGNEANTSSIRKIRMQDHTKDDIQYYVTDKLVKDPRFPPEFHLELPDMGLFGLPDTTTSPISAALTENDNIAKATPYKYDDLVAEITDRAQGVFLWVYLVCIELIKGLTNGDTLDMLKARLRSLPTDLEEYFTAMINRMDKLYHRQCAQILLVMDLAKGPLDILSFYLLETWNIEVVLNIPVQETHDHVLEMQRKRLATTLRARGTDLIEVIRNQKLRNDQYGWEVTFIHRTVKDFLATPKAIKVLKERLGSPFDVNKYLAYDILFQIKRMPTSESLTNYMLRYELRQLLEEMAHYIRLKEVDENVTEERLLDEMEKVLTERSSKGYDFWNGWISGSKQAYRKNSMLAFAVEQDLCIYTARKLEECPDLAKGSSDMSPLLNHARYRVALEGGIRKTLEPNPQMIKTIQKYGSKPDGQLYSQAIDPIIDIEDTSEETTPKGSPVLKPVKAATGEVEEESEGECFEPISRTATMETAIRDSSPSREINPPSASPSTTSFASSSDSPIEMENLSNKQVVQDSRIERFENIHDWRWQLMLLILTFWISGAVWLFGKRSSLPR